MPSQPFRVDLTKHPLQREMERLQLQNEENKRRVEEARLDFDHNLQKMIAEQCRDGEERPRLNEDEQREEQLRTQQLLREFEHVQQQVEQYHRGMDDSHRGSSSSNTTATSGQDLVEIAHDPPIGIPMSSNDDIAEQVKYLRRVNKLMDQKMKEKRMLVKTAKTVDPNAKPNAIPFEPFHVDPPKTPFCLSKPHNAISRDSSIDPKDRNQPARARSWGGRKLLASETACRHRSASGRFSSSTGIAVNVEHDLRSRFEQFAICENEENKRREKATRLQQEHLHKKEMKRLQLQNEENQRREEQKAKKREAQRHREQKSNQTKNKISSNDSIQKHQEQPGNRKRSSDENNQDGPSKSKRQSVGSSDETEERTSVKKPSNRNKARKGLL